MRLHRGLLLLAALASAPVAGRNIVLGNDAGLTSNVKAMYDALKADGHDVIVSVPCTGQSGMGAAIRIMRPLPGIHGQRTRQPPGASQRHDEAAVAASDIAVSVMQVAYDAPPATARAIRRQLGDLLAN